VPSSRERQDAGLIPLPPYTVYENRGVLPRAFVVREAKSMPDRSRLLEDLRTADFRETVFLEEDPPHPQPLSHKGRGEMDAVILDYAPNRVSVEVHTPEPGFLVLTDVWYPGWNATVDGQPAHVYRANYLFRAVEVPAGSHRVDFHFAPRSYEVGKLVSLVTLVLLGAGLVLRGAWWIARR
jgi:hypothetical protein